jgi:hypothetical protein
MLLKNVVQGEVYLVARYGRAKRPGEYRSHSSRDQKISWQHLADDCVPMRALEVGVDVPHYSRKGVLLQQVDPGTLEPRVWSHSGEVAEPDGKLAVSIVMPWSEFVVGYHEFLEAVEEDEERRRVERDLEDARRREANAKSWMERVFQEAKSDIEQVCEVIESSAFSSSGMIDVYARALVDLRYPEGNPYLKDVD